MTRKNAQSDNKLLRNCLVVPFGKKWTDVGAEWNERSEVHSSSDGGPFFHEWTRVNKRENAFVDKQNIPFLGMKFNLKRSSTAGMRNASVFPDPVLAAPKISLKMKMTFISS